MVIGHSGVPQTIGEPLSLLRMPCFFMISGYLFKEKYLNNTTQFVSKKIKGLYFPFVKWSFIFLLLHNFFYHINLYNTEYGRNEFLSQTKQILTMTGSEQLLGGFWFLKELLYASIISFTVFKLLSLFKLRLNLVMLLVCTVFFMVLAYIQSIIPYKVPTIGSQTFMATSYFIAGAALHRADMLFTNINKLKCGIVLFVSFILLSQFVKGTINSQGHTIFPYYAVSIIASISAIYLTRYLGKQVMSALDYVGKRTLYILIFHFISFKIVSFVFIATKSSSITELASFPIVENNSPFLWIIYSIAGVIVPLLIKHGTDKFSSLYKNCNIFKKRE